MTDDSDGSDPRLTRRRYFGARMSAGAADTNSATETTRIPHRAGEQDVDYTADSVVCSYYGNTDTQTTTFQAQ